MPFLAPVIARASRLRAALSSRWAAAKIRMSGGRRAPAWMSGTGGQPPAIDPHAEPGSAWGPPPTGGRAGGFMGFTNAVWGLDAIKARYDRAFPTFVETVQVRVYGQRWAQVEDLYILAMCVVVDLVAGQHWTGGQGIRAMIDRTGKYVEIEYQQTIQGAAENGATLLRNASPNYYFHNPNWLHNEVKIPSGARAQERIPDVLTGNTLHLGSEFDASADRNTLIAGGHYTANRVANQSGYGLDGLTLVTHERHVNPAPVADGLSRGTDLTAILAQALHEAGDPPPVPRTDTQYHVTEGPDPGGCVWADRVDGPQRLGQLKRWWFGFLNASRWIFGWQPLRVPGTAGGGQGTDKPRPDDPPAC